MFCLRSYALLGIAGYADPDGGLRAMGRSRGGAARHNVTKPHRPRTYRDAGRELRERRAGVRVKPEQAPQGATGRGLGWSCAGTSSGPEEEYDLGGRVSPCDGRNNFHLWIVTALSLQVTTSNH